jgi:homoserine dehydrogenase
MADQPIGIAILGHGVVGGGVRKILREQRELLRQRTGLTFDIRYTVVKDPTKHTTAQINATTDWHAAVDDSGVQIVIELMGGTTTAYDAVKRALSKGKHVVTANKSLLSARGPELFALAKRHDACIAFEASCGGGIPIIQALQQGLVANRIDALLGIVNGTCNVILTRMTRNGWSYDQALKEAQKLGFAEADPTLDVSGRDAAQKLAILAGLAFNVRVSEADMSIQGIDSLQTEDIKLIKLLVIAERAGDKLALRVHPTLVHKTDVLAEVSGSFNAISVFGSNLGHTLYYGRGAGQLPTASAVVADLVGVGLGTIPLAFKKLSIFPDTVPAAEVLPIEQLKSRYYLRVMAKDVPGVMADLTRALGDAGISLSAVHQHESSEGQIVPVVITTHLAVEGSMRQALKAIDALPTIKPGTVCLRIVDQPKEFAG